MPPQTRALPCPKHPSTVQINTPTPTPTPDPIVAAQYRWRYEYDALNRLIFACSDWDPAEATCLGESFTYTYDANGNRLSQTTQAGTHTYTYDPANRLTAVDGLPYTWDANGNLLSDGVNSYTYDHANRLAEASRQGETVSYAYNGQGDRLRETAAGGSTEFTLDLESGLTQALSAGGTTYTYGLGRIAQHDAGGAEYFLGDALGSVRQVVDGAGAVTLAQSYWPYGERFDGMGAGMTCPHRAAGLYRYFYLFGFCIKGRSRCF